MDSKIWDADVLSLNSLSIRQPGQPWKHVTLVCTIGWHELYFHLKNRIGLDEVVRMTLTSTHMKGSGPVKSRKLHLALQSHIQVECLQKGLPSGLAVCPLQLASQVLWGWHQHHPAPAGFIYLLNTSSSFGAFISTLVSYNQVQLSPWSDLLCSQLLFTPLEVDFCSSAALSTFDLMGWVVFALLCDYTLSVLLIMAQFCMLKARNFGWRLQCQPLSSGLHLLSCGG